MTARRHISNKIRDEVFSQTAGACYYCGYAAESLDHLVPHSYSANDAEINLVPACGICNSIASNKHFDNLQAKKDYILEQRNSLHWQRKLARMDVTLVPAPSPTMPPAEQPEPPTQRKRREVADGETIDSLPLNNPFKAGAVARKPRKTRQPSLEQEPECTPWDMNIEKLVMLLDDDAFEEFAYWIEERQEMIDAGNWPPENWPWCIHNDPVRYPGNPVMP